MKKLLIAILIFFISSILGDCCIIAYVIGYQTQAQIVLWLYIISIIVFAIYAVAHW